MISISCGRRIRSNPCTFESDDVTKSVSVFSTRTSNLDAKTNAIASLLVRLISSLTAYFQLSVCMLCSDFEMLILLEAKILFSNRDIRANPDSFGYAWTG